MPKGRYTLFVEPGQGKLSREEKMFVKVLREQHLTEIRDDFLHDGITPTDAKVEEVFVEFIKELRRSGEMQRLLGIYLQMKIEAERAKFGC